MENKRGAEEILEPVEKTEPEISAVRSRERSLLAALRPAGVPLAKRDQESDFRNIFPQSIDRRKWTVL